LDGPPSHRLDGTTSAYRLKLYDPRGFAWSPDGTELAVDTDIDGKQIIHIPDLATRPIPSISNANLYLIGWTDSSHIAGYFVRIIPPTPGPSPTKYSSGPQSEIQTVALGVEDLRTGSHTTFRDRLALWESG
jgi:hypothetical protein